MPNNLATSAPDNVADTLRGIYFQKDSQPVGKLPQNTPIALAQMLLERVRNKAAARRLPL